MPTLIFDIEDGSQIEAPLNERTTIGSAEGNDVVAERGDICPRHAEVFLGVDGSWWLRDNDSKHGTFINGSRVSIHRLSPGDVVLFGSVSARFMPDAEITHAIAADTETAINQSHQDAGNLVQSAATRGVKLEALEKAHGERMAALQMEAKKLQAEIEQKKQKLKNLAEETGKAENSCKDSQKKSAELTKALVEGRQNLAAAQSDHASILAQTRQATENLGMLKSQAEETASQIEAAREEIKSLQAASQNLSALNQQLEAQVAETGNRLTSLSTVEERLIQAQEQLNRAKSEHDDIEKSHRRLVEQKSALGREEAELQSKVAALNETRLGHEQEILNLDRCLTSAREDLRSFQIESKNTRSVLEEEISRLQSEASDAKNRLNQLTDKVTETEQRHSGLVQQNLALQAVVKDLQKLKEQHLVAEKEAALLVARTSTLEQSFDETKSRLDALQREEKAGEQKISQLSKQKGLLQELVNRTESDLKLQQQRFEEMRRLSDDAGREYTRQKEHLDEKISELHMEIARLEARLTQAHSWNDELDRLYVKLGEMPDGSPEAREIWHEIQSRKKEITAQLPAGIQVRPQSRPTVVPRVRR